MQTTQGKGEDVDKPNGHAGTVNDTIINALPDPLKDVVSPVQDGLFEMQTGLFKLGHKRARDSGTVESRPDDIEALTEHGRAMAKQTWRDKYDPSKNVHDAMHQDEYQRLKKHRDEAEQAEAQTAANLRDAEGKLASTPKAGPPPRPHPLVTAAFIVLITLTVAPTLHDNIFLSISDDLLAWFAAALSSAFVGGALTLAILTGRRTTWTWIGVAAGVIVGVGLGAVRLSAASTASEGMLAVGFTLVEIAAVLLLEWLASGLRTREEEWILRQDAEGVALAERDAAQADLTRRQDRVKHLNESISAKIALVENRHNRNVQLPELEAVAVNAVIDGYNAGITENIGRVRGVRYAVRRTK